MPGPGAPLGVVCGGGGRTDADVDGPVPAGVEPCGGASVLGGAPLVAGVALSVAIGLVGGFAAGEGALPAAEDVSDRPSFAGASDRAAAAGAPPVLPGAVSVSYTHLTLPTNREV